MHTKIEHMNNTQSTLLPYPIYKDLNLQNWRDYNVSWESHIWTNFDTNLD